MIPEALLYGFGVVGALAWAVMDLADRRVPNRALVIPVLFASPFVVWYLFEEPGRFIMHFAQVGSMAVVAVGLWIGRAFGGADAKGMMALAWVLPSSDYGPPGFFAIMDAALLAYLASSLWLAVTRKRGTPFFAFLAPALGAVVLSPGFIWLPLTFLADWLVKGL